MPALKTRPPDDPPDHVLRAPLPWRNDRLTECGRPAVDVASVIEFADLTERITQHGKRRTAFTVCITCMERASGVTWDDHPVGVLGRELQRVGMCWPIGGRHRPGVDLLSAELRAIAALIEAHRDEFDSFVAGIGQAVDLGDARRARHRRG